MVQALADGELQRELQRELPNDGQRAAEARGGKGGRCPAVAAAKTDIARTSHLEGRSIAALARDYGVSRHAIHTVFLSRWLRASRTGWSEVTGSGVNSRATPVVGGGHAADGVIGTLGCLAPHSVYVDHGHVRRAVCTVA